MFTIVDRRNKQTLERVIAQQILPGTTVVSDEWAAYNGLGNLGYNHMTVNHSLHYVNPVNSIWIQYHHAQSLFIWISLPAVGDSLKQTLNSQLLGIVNIRQES